MFGKYIKYKIKDIAIIVITILIFFAVGSLMGYNLTYFLYAGFLGLFIAFLIYSIEFYGFYKRNKSLLLIKEQIVYELNNFPKADGFTENNYQEIIKNMCFENGKQKQEYDNSVTEMIDYYTLWAHQIKTPIAAMKILIQSNENIAKSYKKELLNDLESQLFKIEQYVEMVLSYLRTSSETTDYVLKKYDIDTIVRNCVKKYSKIFISKRITLNLNETNMKIVTDEKWLSFVIEQILSNALKYTNEGSITIKNIENELIIEDTGIGIAKEDLPRVCEKGFTGYNGRTDKKSTGIGLYLCKQILCKLGHSINVSSEIGKGTKVIITLQ